MNNFFLRNSTISDVLVSYLNIFGVSLGVAILICLGLRLFLDNKKYLTKKRVFGLCFVLSGLLFLLRNLVLAFST